VQARDFEYAREFERGIISVDVHLAAHFSRRERAAEVLETGQAWPGRPVARGQRIGLASARTKTGKRGLDAVAQRSVGGFFATRVARRQFARRLRRFQFLLHRRQDRRVVHQAQERLDAHPACGELAAACCCRARLAEVEHTTERSDAKLQISLGHREPIGTDETERLEGKLLPALPCAVELALNEAALHAFKPERRLLARELDVDVGQCHVGGHSFPRASGRTATRAHGALRFAQLERRLGQVQQRQQARDVRVVRLREYAPGPALVSERRASAGWRKFHAHVEHAGKVPRRARAQRKPMRKQTMAIFEVAIFELQGRLTAARAGLRFVDVTQAHVRIAMRRCASTSRASRLLTLARRIEHKPGDGELASARRRISSSGVRIRRPRSAVQAWRRWSRKASRPVAATQVQRCRLRRTDAHRQPQVRIDAAPLRLDLINEHLVPRTGSLQLQSAADIGRCAHQPVTVPR